MSEKYFDALAAAVDNAKNYDMSFIDKITNQVTKAMDEFILKQFERHGYSEKEVMDLAIAGKIETVEHGNTTDYIVNGLLLFWIERITYYLLDAEDEYYNFRTELNCGDYIPAVRGGLNEENT